MKNKAINISDFSYELPENRIAKYPLGQRDDSRLLVYKTKTGIRECTFSQIVDILTPGQLVVCNNTRVIHARIKFRKKTGAAIEIFCLNPIDPPNYEEAFLQTNNIIWSCMVGNLKKWKDEKLCLEVDINGKTTHLYAEKEGVSGKGQQLVKFSWDSGLSFAELLNATGKIPIPPYLKRESEYIDKTRYQTVYSQYDGSVAAPTAGLHFTKDVMDSMQQKSIPIAEVTLHVGAGTFQPVKTEDAREHRMHGEQIIVKKELIELLIAHDGNVVATGTTTMRTLESIYWLGVKIINGEDPLHLLQWDWERSWQPVTSVQSLEAVLTYMDNMDIDHIEAVTEIMIVPGYRFRIVSALITNFHQPGSTLLLLIAAFIGDKWEEVYQYALENGFRFLSYGDSSLLYKE